GCPGCQAKSNDLKVSQPNDPAEIEADQIADKVMRMPADAPIHVNHRSPAPDKLDAKCAECEEENEKVMLQRKAGFAAAAPNPPDDGPPSVQNAIHSGGYPLDFATRSFFEPRFGMDLGHIRIHADAAASQSARASNARAYALGNSIVFGSGEYRPTYASGRHLLAHELAHVAQAANESPQRNHSTIYRQPSGEQGGESEAPMTRAEEIAL